LGYMLQRNGGQEKQVRDKVERAEDRGSELMRRCLEEIDERVRKRRKLSD